MEQPTGVADGFNDDIRAWLDGIKQGWAARFASAFEAVGVEDACDLVGLSDDVAAELMKELSAHGAKALHVQRINDAIIATTREARATRTRLEGLAGAGGDGSPKRRSSLGMTLESDFRRSGREDDVAPAAHEKKFLAFLSHHKSSCAMEARFIKEELERMVPFISK